MKYAVDRIIDDIAVLENIKDKEKKEEELINLPKRVKEGNILVYKNDTYVRDYNEEYRRRKRLRERIERLKNIGKIKE